MSDTDKTASYSVAADPSAFVAGMDKMVQASKDASKQVESSFRAIENSMGAMSGMFGKLMAGFGAMTAVIAGGSAFKEVIGASVAWTGEAKKLSVQLGVTTERASVLMVAMRHLGIDSEVLSTASTKMTKQIFTNGQAFEKLGVSVKDSNGQYRPTLNIMGEVNEKLKAIKNPIEQNIAGAQVYGKSWSEVRAVLKLTAEELQKAEQKTKDLGLVVGEEGVAQTKKYKESINDMKLVMTSLEVQLGAVLLPVFVKLGAWLSSIGPTAAKFMGAAMEYLGNIMTATGDIVMSLWGLVRPIFVGIGEIIGAVMGRQAPSAMEFFIGVLKAVEVAFAALGMAVNLIVEMIRGEIDVLKTMLLTMAATAERAIRWDFAGAKAAWQAGTAQIEAVAADHGRKLLAIAAAGDAKIQGILSRAPTRKDTPIRDDVPNQASPTYDFSKGSDSKEKSRIHEWEAKLGADKDGFAKEQALAGTAQEFSVQMEKDYWKKILDTVKLTKEERAQVEKKFYAASATIRKEEFDAQIAGEKATLENYKNNHLARLEIADQIYKQNVARFGAESKEAKAAMADVLKEKRAFAEQSMAVDRVIADAKRELQLGVVDDEERAAQHEVDLGQATQARLLAQQEGFEARRYQIKMQGLIARETSLHGVDEDPVALAQVHAQIESLERQHQQRLTAIKRKAELEDGARLRDMYSNMQSGMASVISSTLKGTTSISGFVKGMFSAVTNSVIDMLAQSAAKWLMNLVLTETSTKTSAMGQIISNAGVAGAAATASAAAIPMIGWTIAPEAGLAASQAALAFMPMASAAGGYDIPSGLNPIVQTHAREMILPAKHADVIRNMADSGGSSGSGEVHIHFNSTYTDKAGLERMFRDNGRHIASALQGQVRNFAIKNNG